MHGWDPAMAEEIDPAELFRDDATIELLSDDPTAALLNDPSAFADWK